jgi:hypothetical protein
MKGQYATVGAFPRRGEKNVRPTAKALSRACLVASLCLGLAGCFDYEVELGLTRPGKGYLDVRLALPAHLAQGYPVGQLDSLVFPIPERKTEDQGGRLVISERSEFLDLDELAARRVLFEVLETATGLLGVTDYTYRVTARMELAEGDLPDRDVRPGSENEPRDPAAMPDEPGEKRARQLLARSLGDHHLSMAFRLPGQVVKAQPIIIGASQVPAEISQDGSLVKWKVPLSVLVAENARNTLVFVAEFKGNFTFRAYMQNDAKSHYPDFFDEGLAEGREMGERVRQGRRTTK